MLKDVLLNAELDTTRKKADAHLQITKKETIERLAKYERESYDVDACNARESLSRWARHVIQIRR